MFGIYYLLSCTKTLSWSSLSMATLCLAHIHHEPTPPELWQPPVLTHRASAEHTSWPIAGATCEITEMSLRTALRNSQCTIRDAGIEPKYSLADEGRVIEHVKLGIRRSHDHYLRHLRSTCGGQKGWALKAPEIETIQRDWHTG